MICDEIVSWASTCRNSPQKRTQHVEIAPGTLKFTRKLLPGRIAVHRNSPEKRTQRVAKPPGTLKFAGKLSPGHERFAIHRNSPEKRTQHVEKPNSRGSYFLGINVSLSTEIVTWASTCRGVPK